MEAKNVLEIGVDVLGMELSMSESDQLLISSDDEIQTLAVTPEPAQCQPMDRATKIRRNLKSRKKAKARKCALAMEGSLVPNPPSESVLLFFEPRDDLVRMGINKTGFFFI
jgi:hypothetical protein